MKAGYARVSTKDQTADLQVDALKKAGCAKVYTEVMNGARAERPILSKVLEHLRAGDVLVIWKLDRLGRSLKHLIEVVNELMTRKIGLKSLNDPIDTTTPQGRLIFNPLPRCLNSKGTLFGNGPRRDYQQPAPADASSVPGRRRF